MVTEFIAMNCKIVLADFSPELQKEIELIIKKFEQTASRFIHDNTLDRMNKISPNIPIVLDDIMAELLNQSLEISRKSSYYVNPFHGETMKVIGYTHSFGKHFEPVFESEKQINRFIKDKEPIVQLNKQIIMKTAAFSFDFGGFGKGFIVDHCKKLLLANGCKKGLINAGGDLTVINSRTVGIEHPRLTGKDMVRLEISDCSLATSGKNFRKWESNGNHYHHILNGLTGEPAKNGVLQASVIAKTTIIAETVAKLFCILPFEHAKKLVKKEFPMVSYFVYFDNDQLAIGGDYSLYQKMEVIQ